MKIEEHALIVTLTVRVIVRLSNAFVLRKLVLMMTTVRIGSREATEAPTDCMSIAPRERPVVLVQACTDRLATFPALLPIPLNMIIALQSEQFKTASRLTSAVGAIRRLASVQTLVATIMLRVSVINVVTVTCYLKQTDRKTAIRTRKMTRVRTVPLAILRFYAGLMVRTLTRLAGML